MKTGGWRGEQKFIIRYPLNPSIRQEKQELVADQLRKRFNLGRNAWSSMIISIVYSKAFSRFAIIFKG